MEDALVKTVVGLLVVSLLVFLGAILGTLLGALGGWIVGWFFEETILGFLAALGVTGFKMWQIGAFLGFVGGFFRVGVVRQ